MGERGSNPSRLNVNEHLQKVFSRQIINITNQESKEKQHVKTGIRTRTSGVYGTIDVVHRRSKRRICANAKPKINVYPVVRRKIS